MLNYSSTKGFYPFINKIPTQCNRYMNNPFSKDDVERAIKGMNPNKALGPDEVNAMY